MIYRIKFISDEVEGFIREVKIDSGATFLDLNRIVLKSCDYPDDQMTSFYICTNDWERKEQITREDMGDPGQEDEDLYVMASTSLSEFLDEGSRMEFVFDPFSEREFYMEVKEEITGESLKEAVVSRSVGEPPLQIQDLDMSDSTTGKKDDFFDEDEAGEFYGDASFDSEDLDMEGFEFSENDAY